MVAWRVLINAKKWDQDKFEQQIAAGKPETSILFQSKGAAPMKAVPAVGDTVEFHLCGRGKGLPWVKVMSGIVTAPFQAGIHHQEHSCNIGAARPHAEVEEYAIIKVKVIPREPVANSGQRTWVMLK